MVPKAGIEPTTFGLEGHCSSTELLGQISAKNLKGKGKSKIYKAITFSFFLFPSIINILDIKVLAATYSCTSGGWTTIGTS